MEEPDPRSVRLAHRRAPDEIRRALRPFGYYRPTIRSSLEKTEEGWLAQYRVDAGNPVRIKPLELRITGPGADNPDLRQIVAESDLAPGKQLRHSAYDTTKRRLLGAAVAAGYLDAGFERSRIRVHPEEGRAGVYLVLATGPAYHFGAIHVEQSILDPGYVERLLPVAPGEPLTSERLLDIQFALSDSEQFQRVEVDVQKEASDGAHVPVRVATEPTPARRYRLGGGYGTNTGPRVTAGMELRRVTRTGHSLRTELQVSAVRQSGSVQYRIPLKRPRTDRLTFSGNVQRNRLGDTESRKQSVGISLDELWQGWRRSLYVQAARERTSNGSTRRSRLVTPGVSLSRSHSNASRHPTRGWSLDMDLHGAEEAVLADASFLRLQGGTHWIYSLGERVRLLGRLEAGSALVSTTNALPASERFFTGGARSVRGYAYQSLAPKNADGDVVGGRYLLAGSLETDVRVYGNWGVAAFLDAGNVSDTLPLELERGAGVGLRWFSPVGILRLDFAQALSREDRPIRIHFSMGQDL